MNEYKVFLATEVRIYRVDGHYYADQSFSKILERYNRNFGKISLATRIIDGQMKKNGYIEIDDYCCSFDNIGSLKSFIFKKTPQQMIRHLKDSNLVILRLPSVVSLKISNLISKYSKRYMTEVMGCAWDGYWNHGVEGKIIAPFMFFKIRKIIKRADYCLYVTQRFLQRRYPCGNKSIGVSNVDISCVRTPKKYKSFNKDNITIMTAAALNVKYKGQVYVMRAIRRLKRKYGINVTYYLAGKGDNKRLNRKARKYGIMGNVVFYGMISRDELSKKMREMDIYIQPSLQEGLPRALIEAMSQGCVCLGSRVAGIPELLEQRDVFSPKKVNEIVERIYCLSEEPSKRLVASSSRNIKEAAKYTNDILENRRNNFLKMIKMETE